MFDLEQRAVVAHGVPGLGSFPHWSQDGAVAVWTTSRGSRGFEVLTVGR